MIDVPATNPPAPVGQQGPPARDVASAARGCRVARGSLLLTTGDGFSPLSAPCFALLTPGRKTRTTSSRPAGMPSRGRLQIGMVAGFKSERGGRLHRIPTFVRSAHAVRPVVRQSRCQGGPELDRAAGQLAPDTAMSLTAEQRRALAILRSSKNG
jgi:hypothetical protein